MPRGEYKIGRQEYMRQYRASNKDKLSRHNKTWRDKNKEKARMAFKLSYYKITAEEYERWMRFSVCEICGGPPSGNDHCLAMDHDHNTGKIRGMLCRKCNSALGLANDDPKVLRRMAVYLEERSA